MATEQPRPNAPGVKVCNDCENRWGTGWSNDCPHAAALPPAPGERGIAQGLERAAALVQGEVCERACDHNFCNNARRVAAAIRALADPPAGRQGEESGR